MTYVYKVSSPCGTLAFFLQEEHAIEYAKNPDNFDDHWCDGIHHGAESYVHKIQTGVQADDEYHMVFTHDKGICDCE